jgi:hypothetical protein
MKLRESDRFAPRCGRSRKFYGCTRFPDCKATHGAHPDGKPLGVPADQPTKEMRRAAHQAMNRMMARLGVRKKLAYRLMARLLGKTPQESHVGLLDMGECARLIEALDGLTEGRVKELTSGGTGAGSGQTDGL